MILSMSVTQSARHLPDSNLEGNWPNVGKNNRPKERDRLALPVGPLWFVLCESMIWSTRRLPFPQQEQW